MEYLKIFLSAFGGGMAVVVATILFAKNRMEKLIDKFKKKLNFFQKNTCVFLSFILK